MGTLEDHAEVHDYRTMDVLGTAVIVHRTARGLRAFVNACAHRHTALTLAPSGNRERLRCQYHGWEYDAAGVACRIPDAACFMPFAHGDFRLEPLRLEAVGTLQFVALDASAPALLDWLPRDVSARLARQFSTDRRQVLSLSLQHPCNWKIPIENVLEDYHVAMLHQRLGAVDPRLFTFFQGKPPSGEERFEIHDTHTSVRDELGRDSMLYRRALAWVRPSAEATFVHTHVFPNVLIGETGVVGFFQQTWPCTAATSHSVVRMAMDVPRRGPVARGLAAFAGSTMSKLLFEQLMREDGRVFAAVQRGKASASLEGRLSSTEARIHAFHRWLTSHGDR